MAYDQRAPRFFVTARATDSRLRSAVSFGQSPVVLPATTVELVVVTQQFAPTNSRGARKPGTSDTRTADVLKTLPLSEAINLAGALIHAIAEASAQVSGPVETFDLEAVRDRFAALDIDTGEV